MPKLFILCLYSLIYFSLMPAVGVSETSTELAPVRVFLRDETIPEISLVDFKANPELKELPERIAAMTRKLILPKDGAVPIYVDIVDSMQPNAMFTHDKKGQRKYVLITLGALKYFQSDDEILGVLAHELEHGTSDLQKVVDELKESGNSYQAKALKRVVENENDARAAMERVEKAGGNPYGMIRVLKRLRELGDGTSSSHTATASRIDTLGLVLADAQRSGKKSFKGDTPEHYTHTVTAPFRNFLSSEKFKKRQIDRFMAEAEKAKIHPKLESWLVQLRDDRVYASPNTGDASWRARLEGDAQKSGLYSQPLRAKQLYRTDPFLSQLLTEDEKKAIDERLETISKKIYAEIEKQSDEILGPHFKPRSLAQLNAFMALRRKYEFRENYEDKFRVLKENLDLLLKPTANREVLGHQLEVLRHKEFILNKYSEFVREISPRALDLFYASNELYMAEGQAKGIHRNITVDKVPHPSEKSVPHPFFSHQKSAGEKFKEGFRKYILSVLGNVASLNEFKHELSKVGHEFEYSNGLGREIPRFIFDEVTKAKYLELLSRQVETDLANGVSPDKVAKLFLHIVTARGYEGVFSERDLKSTLLYKSRKQIVEALKSKVPRELLSKLPKGVPVERFKNHFVWAKHAALKELEGGLDFREREQFKKDMLAMRPHFADQKLFSLSPLRRLLFPEGWSDKAANFFYQLEPLLEHYGQREEVPVHVSPVDLWIEKRAYGQWLLKNHPDNYEAVLGAYARQNYLSLLSDSPFPPTSTARKEMENHDLLMRGDIEDFRRKLFFKTVGENKHESYERRIEEAAYSINNLLQGKRIHDLLSRYETVETWPPSDLTEKIEFFLGYQRGVRRWLSEIKVKHPTKVSSSAHLTAVSPALPELDSSVVKSPLATEDLTKVPSKALLDIFFYLTNGYPTDITERVFDELWRRAENDPLVAKSLQMEPVVKRLFLESNRKKLALWQLDRKFDFRKKSKEAHGLSFNHPPKGEVRALVKRILKSIEMMSVDGSDLRSHLIREVEDGLVTNEVETKFLRGNEKWQDNKRLMGIDIPQVINQRIHDNSDKMKFLKYVIGATNEVPSFSQTNLNEIEKWLPQTRSLFKESGILARTYLLQPLLDEENGLLKSVEDFREINDLVLGKYSKEPTFRKLFETYLSVLPVSEQRAVLGYILANYGQSASGAVSLRAILEAMGPFGIKVGQFLRTSGLVSAEFRAELDSFFSKASPPDRLTIIERIKSAFGKNHRIVEPRHLVGSASINYGVLIESRNPETGKKELAVFRTLRDNVENQVHNENSNWNKVIALLEKDKDPEIRRAVSVLKEAQTHSMDTLRRGGPELDHGFERSVYPLAYEAYTSDIDPKTGFKIEVIRSVDALQSLIVKEQQSGTTVLPYVNLTSLNGIKDPQLRSNLASQIFESELKALLKFGTFDPDGHPGNWLIDVEGKRLVRIDYAQFKQLMEADTENFRELLKILLSPKITASQKASLRKLLPHMLEVQGAHSDWTRGLEEVVARADFPKFSAPHERLLFLREKLEEYNHNQGRKEVLLQFRPALRTQLASLSRIAIYRETMQDPNLESAFMNKGIFSKIKGYNHFMESNTFLKLLTKHLDIPYRKVKREVAVDAVKRSSFLSSLSAHCHVLGKLVGGGN